MPWKAKGKEIVRSDTGKVVGHSKNHATAMASVRARYANTKDTSNAGATGATGAGFAARGFAMAGKTGAQRQKGSK